LTFKRNIFLRGSRFTRNDLRENLIERIKELTELNLNHLSKKFNEDDYRQKWTHVIYDHSLEYKHKIDKIKEELILYDCVLLKNSDQRNSF
jgi:hypothetical protein